MELTTDPVLDLQIIERRWLFIVSQKWKRFLQKSPIGIQLIYFKVFPIGQRDSKTPLLIWSEDAQVQSHLQVR